MLNTLSSLIGHQHKAALFLDNTNRVLFANQFAYSLFERASDFHLENQAVVNSNIEQDADYRAALKRVSNQLVPRTIFWRDQNVSYPVRLDILPIFDKIIADESTAVVLVVIETYEPKAAAIKSDFGDFYKLTRSEVSIVELLFQGLSLHECASFKGRTISTIRWTLRNIFTKTNVKSQKELLSIAALFSD